MPDPPARVVALPAADDGVGRVVGPPAAEAAAAREAGAARRVARHAVRDRVGAVPAAPVHGRQLVPVEDEPGVWRVRPGGLPQHARRREVDGRVLGEGARPRHLFE